MIDSTAYFNSLKAELDNGFAFVDYFLVIGIKPETFQETFLYEASLEDLQTKHNDKLSPSIITMFPPFDKKSINIDDSIISHIFLHGFKVTNIQPAPVPFSVVLDNRCLSTEFPYKYIACLVFYENMAAYKTLADISAKFDVNNANNRSSTISASITSPSSSGLNKREDYASYYIPKCICFASVHPLIDCYQELLLKLHSFSTQSKDNRNKIVIDKLIENIVIEIPAPPKGLYLVQFNFTEKCQYEYRQSLTNELPSANFEFERIFRLFKVENICEIVKYLLLEVKLLFFSEDIRIITPVVLGFISFVYPFKYPNLVISILPKRQYNYIESISANIYGINEQYTPSFFKDNNINVNEMTIAVINIDQGAIDIVSPGLISSSIRSTQKKKLSAEEYPDLPKSIRSKLEKRLSKYIADVRSEREREDRSVYSDCFYCFMSSLLSSYYKFIIQDSQTLGKRNGDISSIFNSKDFYMSFSGSERVFYKRLTETKMFIDFISQRVFPKTSTEILEMVYLDERISEKASKNIFSKTKPTFFIGSTVYERAQTYQVSSHKQLSEKDVAFFRQGSNRHLALLKGQYCEILNNDEIIFTNYIFPALLTEYLFYHNADLYYAPPFLSKYVEEKNKEMISKINTSISINHISQMENYIYLAWVNMWALTFWYHSQEEREFRFSQLLTVLDKIWDHEIQLFILLFDVLKRMDEKTMIIILYAKLIKYHLNPSWEIYSMITNIIDKDQLPLMIQTLDKAKEQNESQYVTEIASFKKRTMKDAHETYILSEEVVFYAYETCIDCQKQFDLHKTSKDFNAMQQEEMWVKCPNCSNTILPTLKFKFGIEVFNQDITSASSSLSDSITLNSPKYLREQVKHLSKGEQSHFEVNGFKSKHKKVFWNLIWYFQLMELDISFMLPYHPLRGLNDAAFNNNSLKQSIGKNIQLAQSSESSIERMTSITKEQLNIFEKEELREQQVYNFDVIPNIGMVPVQGGSDQNVSVFGYALNTSDMNSWMGENMLRSNCIVIDEGCTNQELDGVPITPIQRHTFNHLESIKEDYENNLNEEEDNAEDELKPFFDFDLGLDNGDSEDDVTPSYQKEEENPLYISII